MGWADRPMPVGDDGRVRWWALVPWWFVVGILVMIGISTLIPSLAAITAGGFGVTIGTTYRERRAAATRAESASAVVRRRSIVGDPWAEPIEAAALSIVFVALTLIVTAVLPDGWLGDDPVGDRPLRAGIGAALLGVGALALALAILVLRHRRAGPPRVDER